VTVTTPTTTTAPNPDTTPPTPKINPLAKLTLGNKITATWSGTDTGGSGLKNFDVQYRVAAWNGNFGAWTNWKMATTAKSAQYTTTPGHSVCFRVRARDNANNVSGYTAQSCTAVPLLSTSLSYSPGWTKTSTTAAYGGVQYSTKTKGKTATLAGVKARTIDIVMEECTSCGSVQVKFNGAVVKNVPLAHAGTLHKQIIPVASFPSVKTGTVLITVTSANGKIVAIEGLGVLDS
jgi:hypothetical protein